MKRKNYERPSMKVVMLQQSAALMIQASGRSYEQGGQQNWDNSSVESSRNDYQGGGDLEWE